MRASSAFLVVVGTLVVGAIAYEVVRSRPPIAEPVQSRRPLRDDEKSRLEGGFLWRSLRGARTLVELRADSMLEIEGGAHFLRDVGELKVFAEDGRPISLSADRGTLRQLSPERTDVEIVLSGNVVIRDAGGATLRTDELIYDAPRAVLRAPGPSRIEDAALRARVESFQYQPDSRLLETDGGVDVEAGEGTLWRVDAERATYRFGSGEIAFPGPFRARQPDRTILAAEGILRSGTGGSAPRFEGAGPVLVRGPGADPSWQIAASTLSVQGGADASDFDRIEAGGPATIAMRSTREDGATDTAALDAEHWVVTPGAAAGALTAVADRGFRARWNEGSASGAWNASGSRLEIVRDGTLRIVSVVASGAIVIRGQGGLEIRGDKTTWTVRTPDEIRVRGTAATARKEGHVIEAPLLRYMRDREVVLGEEGAITEIDRLGDSESSLFSGDEPVRVRSALVRAPVRNGPIEFDGPVQAWQEDTTLRSARMRFDPESETLVADEDVVGRFLIGKGEERRPVRLSTRRLEYRARERHASLQGGARFQDRELVVESERMEFWIASGGGVERMVAEGDVRLTQGGDAGFADRMTWTGGQVGVVELLGEERLARLVPKETGKEVLATRIRYFPGTRTFSTEGGGGRTVVSEPVPESGAPSGDQNE